MGEVSSKYQITLPRDLARSHRISLGEEVVFGEVVFGEVGSALYLRRAGQDHWAGDATVLERVDLFDQASQRQAMRNGKYSGHLHSCGDRGWTLDELYQR